MVCILEVLQFRQFLCQRLNLMFKSYHNYVEKLDYLYKIKETINLESDII
jgi:hypothetical protein